MIAAGIIGAEVMFWALLLGGLAVRYPLRRKRIGLAMLALTPVVDPALIALTYVDISRGADVTYFHGLSPVYVGFTVAFGPSIIRSMDARVARRYGAETPDEPQSRRILRGDLAKVIAAGSISAALLAIGLALAGWDRSFWLIYWIITVVFIVAAWPVVESWATRREARGQE